MSQEAAVTSPKFKLKWVELQEIKVSNKTDEMCTQIEDDECLIEKDSTVDAWGNAAYLVNGLINLKTLVNSTQFSQLYFPWFSRMH